MDGKEKNDQAGTTPEEIIKENAEYDATWEELKKLDGGDKKETPVEDDLTKDLPPEKVEASDVSTEQQPKSGDELKSEKYGTVKSMEKALDDTKTYAHRLEKEKAELVKKLEDAQKGGATQAEVAEAKQAVQAAQDDLDAIKTKVYADYPELQQLIDPILEQNKNLKDKVVSLETVKAQDDEKDHKKKMLDNFNTKIKPKVVEAHADFDTLMQSEDYWAWAEKQRPGLRTAALDSSDPDDIIYAVSEFKKSQASAQVPALKDKEKNEREARLKNSQTLRGGSSQFPAVKHEKDADTYDWEGAGEVLKKQGIT